MKWYPTPTQNAFMRDFSPFVLYSGPSVSGKSYVLARKAVFLAGVNTRLGPPVVVGLSCASDEALRRVFEENGWAFRREGARIIFPYPAWGLELVVPGERAARDFAALCVDDAETLGAPEWYGLLTRTCDARGRIRQVCVACGFPEPDWVTREFREGPGTSADALALWAQTHRVYDAPSLHAPPAGSAADAAAPRATGSDCSPGD